MFNENGNRLINNPNNVLTAKGAKNDGVTEKAEADALVGSCNAEGAFPPLALIFKELNKKAELEKECKV